MVHSGLANPRSRFVSRQERAQGFYAVIALNTKLYTHEPQAKCTGIREQRGGGGSDVRVIKGVIAFPRRSQNTAFTMATVHSPGTMGKTLSGLRQRDEWHTAALHRNVHFSATACGSGGGEGESSGDRPRSNMHWGGFFCNFFLLLCRQINSRADGWGQAGRGGFPDVDKGDGVRQWGELACANGTRTVSERHSAS